MGQGWAREGLGGGRAAAEAAIGTWDAFARTHAGVKSADALAHAWLAIDTALFALGGYGLVSLVIVLLVRRVAWLPGWVRGCLLGAGILGMGTAALDVVENVLTHLVLAADGAGPAGLLRTWGSVKWLVAALALAAALVGVIAWVVAAKRAGVARPAAPAGGGCWPGPAC